MPKKAKTLSKLTVTKLFPYILILSGLLGLFASFVLTLDKLKLAENPAFTPNCDLNPVLSCGSVMATPEGAVFGFPNPWLGLVTYAVIITVGMGIIAGGKFKRWFWLGLELGTLFGVIFIHWLFYQSVYHINALCIYCITTWIATITAFWYTTIYNLTEGHIKFPARLIGVGDFLKRHHLDILILWFLIIFVLILKHFWYYYGDGLTP